MRKILAIAKREMAFYFYGTSAWMFSGIMILMSSWLYLDSLFLGGQINLYSFWSILILMFSVFIPAISMNLIAEEKRKGGWENLLSAPISEKELILGKYLGALSYISYSLILTAPLLLLLNKLGGLEWGIVLSSILGIFLIGASYLAIGLLASSIAKSGIAAFLLSMSFLLVNNLTGEAFFLGKLPLWAKKIFSYASLFKRSESFFLGVIDINDLIFFGSWISIFLILSVIVLKTRDRE